jgi:hypothetical protein
MSEANVELVKGIFGDWERGDFSSVDWADPEIEFTIPGPESQVQRGVESMAAPGPNGCTRSTSSR